MNIEITNQERNELLEREDFELDINHAGEATPSENDVRKQLAAELDLDPLTIRVDHIYSSTGRGYSKGVVTVFDEPIMDELPEEGEETEEAEEESEDAGAVDEVEVDIDTDEETEESADTEEDAEDEEEAEEEDESETDAESGETESAEEESEDEEEE